MQARLKLSITDSSEELILEDLVIKQHIGLLVFFGTLKGNALSQLTMVPILDSIEDLYVSRSDSKLKSNKKACNETDW